MAVGEVLADPGVDAVHRRLRPTGQRAARARSVTPSCGRSSGEPAGRSRTGRAASRWWRRSWVPPSTPRSAPATVRIPLFEFPNGAARVLGRMADHGAWLAEPVGVAARPRPGRARRRRGRSSPDSSSDHPDGAWLDVDAAAALLELLRAADDAVPPGARRPTRRSRPARPSGDPVVVKATGLERLSKSEAGGVVARRPRARRGAGRLRADDRRCWATPWSRPWCSAWRRPGSTCGSPPTSSRSYGAVISLGLGGSVAQANPRRSVRVLPLTDADARRPDRCRHRSCPCCDRRPRRRSAPRRDPALEELLLRLAWVVEQLPELADVELNPVLAAGDAVSITAARVRVAPAAWTPDPEVRRLH